MLLQFSAASTAGRILRGASSSAISLIDLHDPTQEARDVVVKAAAAGIIRMPLSALFKVLLVVGLGYSQANNATTAPGQATQPNAPSQLGAVVGPVSAPAASIYVKFRFLAESVLSFETVTRQNAYKTAIADLILVGSSAINFFFVSAIATLTEQPDISLGIHVEAKIDLDNPQRIDTIKQIIVNANSFGVDLSAKLQVQGFWVPSNKIHAQFDNVTVAPGIPTKSPTPPWREDCSPSCAENNSLLSNSSATQGIKKTENKLIIGVSLCMLAACALALSMNIQCYALSSPEKDFLNMKKTFLCSADCVTRNSLWSFGLLLYAFANMFYVVGLGFAPLSLMSALFATVLVFNAIFANRFLGEELKSTDIWGLLIIVGSVGVCGFFGPRAESDPYTADKIFELTKDMTGIGFWSVSLGVLAVLIYKVHLFETEFPNFGLPATDMDDPTGEEVRKPHFGLKEPVKEPDRATVVLMMVVYPGVLGIFESLGQVGMKAVSSMMAVGETQFSKPVFWITLVLLCLDGYMIIQWLARVYGKFETTDCLPIE